MTATKRRRLDGALHEVIETRLFLAEWGRIPEARNTDWYRGNEETLRAQLEELRTALVAFCE
jgi:hypothetical protein